MQNFGNRTISELANITKSVSFSDGRSRYYYHSITMSLIRSAKQPADDMAGRVDGCTIFTARRVPVFQEKFNAEIIWNIIWI